MTARASQFTHNNSNLKTLDANDVMQPLQASSECTCELKVDIKDRWRQSERLFSRCLVGEKIACDVDEVLWSDQAEKYDAAEAE